MFERLILGNNVAGRIFCLITQCVILFFVEPHFCIGTKLRTFEARIQNRARTKLRKVVLVIDIMVPVIMIASSIRMQVVIPTPWTQAWIASRASRSADIASAFRFTVSRLVRSLTLKWIHIHCYTRHWVGVLLR